MADPMRIRAQAAGDKATVRVLMAHEMETGLRKDAAGKVIPAWFIQEVSATLNGKTVLTAQWGTAVAKNPFLQFVVKGAKAGDKISISWVDNRGDRRTDEVIAAINDLTIRGAPAIGCAAASICLPNWPMRRASGLRASACLSSRPATSANR